MKEQNFRIINEVCRNCKHFDRGNSPPYVKSGICKHPDTTQITVHYSEKSTCNYFNYY
jgi:hypothetical protein